VGRAGGGNDEWRCFGEEDGCEVLSNVVKFDVAPLWLRAVAPRGRRRVNSESDGIEGGGVPSMVNNVVMSDGSGGIE